MTSPKELYLELLKKSLLSTIYDEPPIPLELYWSRRGWAKRRLLPAVTTVFGWMGTELRVSLKQNGGQSNQRRFWPVQAHSMIGLKRMDNLVSCVQTVLHEQIPGDLIETGVWRGGACIMMRGVLAVNGVTDRRVFVADSFCGLPKPNEALYPSDKGDKHHRYAYLAVSRQQVEDNFRRYGLLDSQVVFLEGWFKDTLPNLPSKQMAIIRLDGDMYESTMDALRHLYPRLSPGGFCIIDDYCLEGCREAVHDYRKEHRIEEPIQDIDGRGAYWRRKQ